MNPINKLGVLLCKSNVNACWFNLLPILKFYDKAIFFISIYSIDYARHMKNYYDSGYDTVAENHKKNIASLNVVKISPS